MKGMLPCDDAAVENATRNRFVIFAVAAVMGLVLWQPVVTDPDLWGHVLFGRQFLHEPLPATNGYSFVAGDHPWIKHEWAAQAIIGWAWELAGARGLVALKALVVALLLLVLVPAMHAATAGDDGSRPRDAEATAFVMLTMLALVNAGMLVRPQLATFLLVALLLVGLDAIIRGRLTPWALVLVPPLFVAWVNLHGGFLVGLGLVGLAGCLVALAMIAPSRSAAKPSKGVLAALIAAFLASVPATLLNPAGPELWRFLARSLPHPPSFVTEWRPLLRAFDNAHVPLFLGLLALAAFLVVAAARSGTLRLSLAGGAFAVFASATFLSIRHLPLAAIAGCLALSQALPPQLERFRRGPRAPAIARGLRSGLAAMALAWLVRPLPALLDGPFHLRVPEEQFPDEAVNAMMRAGLEGDAVVLYDWAGYVLFRAWPAIRVDVDSRCDTAYPMSLLEETVAATRSRQAGQAMLARAQPDFVLMPPAIVDEWGLRGSPEWELLHEDPLAIVVRRRSAAAASPAADEIRDQGIDRGGGVVE